MNPIKSRRSVRLICLIVVGVVIFWELLGKFRLTPFQVAVTNGHLATAALLVDKGADVNVRDWDGNTLLHWIFLHEVKSVHDLPPTNWLACASHDPDRGIFEQYLVTPPFEQTSRHRWDVNSLPQLFCFLLASGIDVKAKNRAGETVLQLLLEGKARREVFERPMMVRLLIAHGGNIDERDADGNTALHHVVAGEKSEYGDKVDELVAYGANVNVANSQGRTPLHVAVQSIGFWMNNNAVNALLRAKADVNARNAEGQTPLHMVALLPRATAPRGPLTATLLNFGANPNARDSLGRTPLHLFLSKPEDSGCILALINAGADLSAKDNTGKTPLHYLAGTKGDDPMEALWEVRLKFLGARVDLDSRDSEGNTPLMTAAKSGSMGVYAWLKEAGANLDATNNFGETPRQLYQLYSKTDEDQKEELLRQLADKVINSH